MTTKTKERNYVEYGRAVDVEDVGESTPLTLMESVRMTLESVRKRGILAITDYGFAFAREPENGHLVFICSAVCRNGEGDIPTFQERLEEKRYRNIFMLNDETLLSIARERCN